MEDEQYNKIIKEMRLKVPYLEQLIRRMKVNKHRNLESVELLYDLALCTKRVSLEQLLKSRDLLKRLYEKTQKPVETITLIDSDSDSDDDVEYIPSVEANVAINDTNKENERQIDSSQEENNLPTLNLFKKYTDYDSGKINETKHLSNKNDKLKINDNSHIRDLENNLNYKENEVEFNNSSKTKKIEQTDLRNLLKSKKSGQSNKSDNCVQISSALNEVKLNNSTNSSSSSNKNEKSLLLENDRTDLDVEDLLVLDASDISDIDDDKMIKKSNKTCGTSIEINNSNEVSKRNLKLSPKQNDPKLNMKVQIVLHQCNIYDLKKNEIVKEQQDPIEQNTTKNETQKICENKTENIINKDKLNKELENIKITLNKCNGKEEYVIKDRKLISYDSDDFSYDKNSDYLSDMDVKYNKKSYSSSDSDYDRKQYKKKHKKRRHHHRRRRSEEKRKPGNSKYSSTKIYSSDSSANELIAEINEILDDDQASAYLDLDVNRNTGSPIKTTLNLNEITIEDEDDENLDLKEEKIELSDKEQSIVILDLTDEELEPPILETISSVQNSLETNQLNGYNSDKSDVTVTFEPDHSEVLKVHSNLITENESKCKENLLPEKSSAEDDSVAKKEIFENDEILLEDTNSTEINKFQNKTEEMKSPTSDEEIYDSINTGNDDYTDVPESLLFTRRKPIEKSNITLEQALSEIDVKKILEQCGLEMPLLRKIFNSVENNTNISMNDTTNSNELHDELHNNVDNFVQIMKPFIPTYAVKPNDPRIRNRLHLLKKPEETAQENVLPINLRPDFSLPPLLLNTVIDDDVCLSNTQEQTTIPKNITTKCNETISLSEKYYKLKEKAAKKNAEQIAEQIAASERNRLERIRKIDAENLKLLEERQIPLSENILDKMYKTKNYDHPVNNPVGFKIPKRKSTITNIDGKEKSKDKDTITNNIDNKKLKDQTCKSISKDNKIKKRQKIISPIDDSSSSEDDGDNNKISPEKCNKSVEGGVEEQTKSHENNNAELENITNIASSAVLLKKFIENFIYPAIKQCNYQLDSEMTNFLSTFINHPVTTTSSTNDTNLLEEQNHIKTTEISETVNKKKITKRKRNITDNIMSKQNVLSSAKEQNSIKNKNSLDDEPHPKISKKNKAKKRINKDKEIDNVIETSTTTMATETTENLLPKIVETSKISNSNILTNLKNVSIKMPRMKELDLLNRDVNDMFIREEVLSISGRRQCSIIAERQIKASNMENLLNSENEMSSEGESSSSAVKTGQRGRPRKISSDFHDKSDSNNNSDENRNDMNTRDKVCTITKRRRSTTITDNVDGEINPKKTNPSVKTGQRGRPKKITLDFHDKSNSNNNSDENRNDNVNDMMNTRDNVDTISKRRKSTVIENEISSKKTSLSVKTGQRGRPRKRTSDLFDKSDSSNDLINKENETETADLLVAVKSVPFSSVQNQQTQKKRKTLKNTNPEHYISDSNDYLKRCLICSKTCSSIISHYVNKHEKREIFISRLSKLKINQLLEKPNLANITEYTPIKCTSICIFCDKEITDTLSHWYEHYTSHTGEFSYQCSECNLFDWNKITLKNHCRSECGSKILNYYTPNTSEDCIEAYICKICNYIQIYKANIIKHLKSEHELNPNELELQCLEVILIKCILTEIRIENEAIIPKQEEVLFQMETDESISSEHNYDLPEYETVENEDMFKNEKFIVTNDIPMTTIYSNPFNSSNNIILNSELTDKTIDDITKELGCEEINSVETKVDITTLNEQLSNVETSNTTDESQVTKEIHSNQIKSPNKEKTILNSELTDKTIEDIANSIANELRSEVLNSVEIKPNVTILNEQLSTAETLKATESQDIKPNVEILNKIITESKECINKDENNIQSANIKVEKDNQIDNMNTAINETESIKNSCDNVNEIISNKEIILKNLNDKNLSKNNCNDETQASSNEQSPLEESEPNSSISTIMNIGYQNISTGVLKYFCLIKGCLFPPTTSIDELRNHLQTHKNHHWHGKCSICNKCIFNNSNMSLELELNHMIINHTSILVDSSKQDEFNILKPWVSNSKCKKDLLTCNKHLTEANLLAFYKCMGSDCIFLTNHSTKMLLHYQQHELITRNNLNQDDTWLECSYCDQHLDNAVNLIKHIDDEHKLSIFQCSLCFYRSCAAPNVKIHQNLYHKTILDKKILICHGTRKSTLDEMKALHESREINVQPLKCAKCKAAFYIYEDFQNHITKIHPNCSLQDNSCDMYACFWCIFGSSSLDVMRYHMVNKHPNRFLQICERVLNNNLENNGKIDHSSVNSTNIKYIGEFVHKNYLKKCSCSEDKLRDGNFSECTTDYSLSKKKIDNVIAENQKPIENIEMPLSNNNSNMPKNSDNIIDPELIKYLELATKNTGLKGKELYRCPVWGCCREAFENICNFEVHLTHKHLGKLNDPASLYYCHICVKCIKLLEFSSHMTNHEEHNHLCYYCGETFPNYVLGENHLLSKHMYSNCELINLVDNKSNYYRILISKTETINMIKIQENILKILKSKDEFNNLCQLTEEDKKYLENLNIPKYVNNRDRYLCTNDLCNFKGTDESELEKHFKNKHSKVLKYDCVHCNKSEKINSGAFYRIKDHLKLHGELLTVCNTCNFFHYKADIVYQHSYEKHKNYYDIIINYIRDDVNIKKATRIIYNLDTSNKINDNNVKRSNFYCLPCKKYFNEYDEICNHMISAHNEKQQFLCPYCTYWCKERDLIDAHIKSVHGKRPIIIRSLFCIRDKKVDTNNENIITSNIVESNVVENTIQSNTIESNAIQLNAIESNTIQSNAIEPNMIGPNAIEPNTIRPNVIQLNTIQPNIIQPNIRNNTLTENVINPTNSDNITVKGINNIDLLENLENDQSKSSNEPINKGIRLVPIAQLLQRNKEQDKEKERKARIKITPKNPNLIAHANNSSNTNSIPSNDLKMISATNNQYIPPNSTYHGMLIPQTTIHDRNLPSTSGENLLAGNSILKNMPQSVINMPQSVLNMQQSTIITNQLPSTSNYGLNINHAGELQHPSNNNLHLPSTATIQCAGNYNSYVTHRLGNLLFTCSDCSSEFLEIKALFFHWENLHKKQDLECQFYVSRKFCCIYCDYTAGFIKLKKHYQTVHPDKLLIISNSDNPYQCTECQYISKDIIDLINHNVNRHPKLADSYQSERNIFSQEIINELININYPKSLIYKCNICKSLYRNRYFCAEHIAKCHNPIEKTESMKCFWRDKTIYGCHHCQMFYETEEFAIQHMRHHLLTYICKFCKEPFSSNQLLRLHNLTHNAATATYDYAVTKSDEIFYRNMILLFPNGILFRKFELRNTKYGNASDFKRKIEQVYRSEIKLLSKHNK